MPDIIRVQTQDEYEAAGLLFRQYAKWLNIDLSFQHFDEELDQLKQMYGPPVGGIILCRQAGEYIACVAIRKQEGKIAELKRMYVLPENQHQGVGQILLTEAIKLAGELKYEAIRLDTLNSMTPAINLYKKAGFNEIPAYYFNPEKTAVYFEMAI